MKAMFTVKNKKRLIGIAVFLMFGTLFGAFCQFVTQVVLARTLGPYDYGVFSAALALVTVLSPLCGFGVQAFWLKAFAEEGGAAIRWLPGSFRFVGLTTSAVILTIFAIGIAEPNNLVGIVTCTLALVAAGNAFAELVMGKLQLEARFDQLAIWQMAPHVTRLLLFAILFALLREIAVQQAAVVYLLTAAATVLVGSVLLNRMRKGKMVITGNEHAPILHVKRGVPNVRHVAKSALPFGLAGIFYVIYFQSNVITLKYMSGEIAVGIYSVAFMVMAAIYLLPSVVYQKLLLPHIHRLAYKNLGELRRVHNVGSLIMLALGLIAGCSVWFIAPLLVSRLFGDDYEAAATLLKIFAVCAPIRFVATSVGAVLSTRDHMKQKVKIMGSVAIANVIISIALIGLFSEVGAAITAVICEFMILVSYFWYMYRHVFNQYGAWA
ncbi:oligosaccharide flippase family protein [Lysobacter sp. A289]